MVRRGTRRLDRRAHAASVQRHLLDALHRRRRLHTDQVEQRRRDIDRMMKLRADRAALRCGDRCRPVNDQRVANTAAVRGPFVAFVGRVAGHRPTPRIVTVRSNRANIVEPLDRFADVLLETVVETVVIKLSRRLTLPARAVVAEQDEDRIVEPGALVEEVDQPPDLLVGVFEERRKRLLQPGRESPLVIGQLIPRLDARVARCQLGPRRNNPALDLPLVHAFANDIPALVELPAPAQQIVIRRLVRSMRRAERDVAEDRTFRHQRDRVAHHQDRLIDDVGRQMVTLLGRRRRIDELVVATEFGLELIGLAQQEAVVAIEPAAQRPMRERSRRRRVPHRGEVPLARRQRREARPLQDLRDRGGLRSHRAGHVWIAAVPMRDAPHSDGVMIASRQQRGPRRRAQRGGVERVESQAARR